MPERVLRDGWWFPAGDTECWQAVLRDQGQVEQWLGHVAGRTLAVQAGGNVGVYPTRLASYFETVYTFEPDDENWACLALNVSAPNVVTQRAALGSSARPGRLQRVERNAGAHYLLPDFGGVSVVPLDSLSLPACDLLALDVEGAELEALKGAVETVAKFHPTIIVEDKGHVARFGQTPREMHKWLEDRGYRRQAQYGRDVVWT